MTQNTIEKDVVTARISRIVESLIESDRYFQERLDLEEMIDYVSGLAKAKFSPEQLQAIDDEDLTERIDKVLTIEAVSGTLNDLTPEQMEIFDAAVEGRW